MTRAARDRPGQTAGAGPRALTARSVVASVLLGTDPPQLPAGTLVRTAELFGITEGTTRVAISRMLAAGELQGDGARYRLAGPLLARQRRQHQSRRAEALPWSGAWRVAVVPAGSRPASERTALRQAMRALRLGEWREGVWARPDNIEPVDGPHVSEARRQCTWMSATLDGESDDLAGRLWDLAGWANDARRLVGEMDLSQPALDQGRTEQLAPAFVLAASVLRHQQADPLLPPALLPSDWPGEDLRRRYDRFESAFQSLLREWTRARD